MSEQAKNKRLKCHIRILRNGTEKSARHHDIMMYISDE